MHTWLGVTSASDQLLYTPSMEASVHFYIAVAYLCFVNESAASLATGKRKRYQAGCLAVTDYRLLASGIGATGRHHNLLSGR